MFHRALLPSVKFWQILFVSLLAICILLSISGCLWSVTYLPVQRSSEKNFTQYWTILTPGNTRYSVSWMALDSPSIPSQTCWDRLKLFKNFKPYIGIFCYYALPGNIQLDLFRITARDNTMIDGPLVLPARLGWHLTHSHRFSMHIKPTKSMLHMIWDITLVLYIINICSLSVSD